MEPPSPGGKGYFLAGKLVAVRACAPVRSGLRPKSGRGKISVRLKELRVPLRSCSSEDISRVLTWPTATVSLRYRERIRCPGRAGTQKEALRGPDSRSMVPGEPRATEGARSAETERTVSGAGWKVCERLPNRRKGGGAGGGESGANAGGRRMYLCKQISFGRS